MNEFNEFNWIALKKWTFLLIFKLLRCPCMIQWLAVYNDGQRDRSTKMKEKHFSCLLKVGWGVQNKSSLWYRQGETKAIWFQLFDVIKTGCNVIDRYVLQMTKLSEALIHSKLAVVISGVFGPTVVQREEMNTCLCELQVAFFKASSTNSRWTEASPVFILAGP